jgi:hypothetical protein
MPFYDPSSWELVKVIQQNKQEILNEFNRAVELKLIQEKFNATTSFDEKLYKGYVGFLGIKMDINLWSPEEKKVYSEDLQKQIDANRKLCPVSSSIINQFPYIRQFFWNTLPGKGQIRPHYGVNGRIWGKTPDHARIQFCWEPGENCTFFLEDECIEYTEDLCFGFHDGMDLHWVKNDGDKLRSVLILDLWGDKCEAIQWGNLQSTKGKFIF